MSRFVDRVAFAAALGWGMMALPGFADDETKSPAAKPAPAPAAKAIDWSKYAHVTDIVGEIVKADDKSLTVRVTWVAPANGNNRRPALHQNSRNFHHPHAPSRANTQLKQQHHDYVIEYAPEGLVRTKAMPTKIDDSGKKAALSTKELQEYITPPGAPSYAAARGDLVPGAIVEVFVVREKSIAADKVTEGDLRVKYAIILGQDPNPPKDVSARPRRRRRRTDSPQLGLGLSRGGDDFRFPVRVVRVERERHAARTVHHRPQPVGAVRGLHVGRGPALRAVARHQEPHVRHDAAEFRQLPRVGGPDDRPHVTQPALADRARVPTRDRVGDVAVYRLAVAHQILEQPAPGLLVRTSTNTPRCAAFAALRNGSTASRPRYGLMVSESASHIGYHSSPIVQPLKAASA